jgi:hypothetical protein
MKNIFLSLVLALLFASGMASAANPFIEIRDQLDQLDEQVSANTAAINNLRGLSLYVNGVKRGAIIDWSSGGNPPAFSTAISLRILLDSEYVALVSTAGDGLRQTGLAYESANCTGQPYFALVDMNPMLARQGVVIVTDSPAPDTLYFAQADTPIESITINSENRFGVCSTKPAISAYGVKVTVNDETLTGVTHSDFIGVLKLGY